jgi:RNA polymerase sigma factor (sigma-70 family)
MVPARAGREATGDEEQLSGRSDEALVHACRAGDHAAWKELIVRYRRLIYGVPLRHGLSAEQADDIFQQTCIRLFERLQSLRDPAHVRSWLVTTAQRLTLDLIAARRPDPLYQDALTRLPARDTTLEQDLLLLEEQERIRAAVDRLPARCRDLVRLLFYDPEHPSYAEVARRLEVPLGSVGPVRRRCFEKLRRLL